MVIILNKFRVCTYYNTPVTLRQRKEDYACILIIGPRQILPCSCRCMMELAQESLAGRTAIIHMPSLSQHELYGTGENHKFVINHIRKAWFESLKNNKKVLLYILAASVLIFCCIFLAGQNKKQMLSDFGQNILAEEPQSILTEESVAASGKVENETMAEVENEVKTELSDTVSGTVSESEDIIQIPEKKYTVCIDPGHFLDEEDVMEAQNTYGYRESNVSLRLAIALKAELAKYGIDAYMTRETDHITLGGYTDKELDKGHISLRGEFAKGSDLFVSLHTNSNGIDANQVGTFEQPKEINKTIIIVNKVAYNSDTALNIANNIGTELSKVNYDSGLSFTNQFIAVTRDTAREWTAEYNDGLNQVGTVCYRWGTKGDYYGVLRGASNVGVPGIIIEHGFHSVEELRKQAMTQELVEKWAKADAYAIAKGFGR